ncbi:MAG: hypothetical protein [Caudoviricetes sp.]|nr:MAG: hypothetical protein [Caudoviricetes sp.]
MGIKVNLKNVRVGWVNVFEKAKDSVDKNGKPIKGKFQFTVYLDKKDPQLPKLEEAARKVVLGALGSATAADKWMERNYGFGNHSDKCAVRDLAERDKPIEGLESGLYMKATSHKSITVATSMGEIQIKAGDPLPRGEDGFPRGLTREGDDIEGKEVYAGCFSNVSVDLYWHKDFKNLCACALGIRFREDGDAFGGAGEVATDDDLSDEDDDKPVKTKRRPSRDEGDEEEERPRKKRRNYEDDEE